MIWANKKKKKALISDPPVPQGTGGSNFSRFFANAWCGVIDGPLIAPLIAKGSLQTQPT